MSEINILRATKNCGTTTKMGHQNSLKIPPLYQCQHLLLISSENLAKQRRMGKIGETANKSVTGGEKSNAFHQMFITRVFVTYS